MIRPFTENPAFNDHPVASIVVSTRSKEIICINKAARKLFGEKKYSWTKKHVTDLLPDFDFKLKNSKLDFTCRGKAVTALVTSTKFKLANSWHYLIAISNTVQNEKRVSLNQSTNDFQNAIQNSSIVSRADKHGTITYVNENFVKISGYNCNELIGQNHRIINSGYHSKSFWASMWKTIANGRIWRAEVKNRAKDGTFYWVDTFVMPFIDEKGKVKEFLSIRNDITASKDAEEALTKSNVSLSETLIFGKMGSAELELQSSQLKVSKELFQLLDIEASGSQSFPLEHFLKTFVDPEFLPKVHQKISEGMTNLVGSKKVVELEFEMITAKGRRIWIEGKGIFNENSALGILHDVTERKKTEQQIAKEKELSNTVINSLPGVFYLIDENGKFLRWNKNFEEVTGYSGLEVGNMLPTDFFEEGADRTLISERVGKVFIDGQADAEADFFTKTKCKVPYYFTGKLIDFEGKNCLIGMGIDVTRRRDAEQAAVTRARMIDTMLNGITDGFFATDRNLNFTLISPVFANLANIAGNDMLGENIVDVFPHLQGAELVSILKEAVITQKSKIFEHRPGANQQQVLQASVYPNQEGLFIYYKDITELNKAEKIRVDLLKRLERLSNNIPGFIYEFRINKDGTSHFPYVSKGIKEIYGLSPDDVADDANTLFAHMHPDDADRVAMEVEHAAKTLTAGISEFRVKKSSGETIWVKTNATIEPQTDGSLLWYGYAENITKSKEAELLLKESENDLRALLNSSTDPTYFIDLQGRIRLVNAAGVVTTNVLTKHKISVGDSFLDLLPDQWKESFMSNFHRVLKGEIIEFEREVQVDDGRSMWFQVRYLPVRDDQNNIIGVSNAGTDITMRKTAERALLASNMEKDLLIKEIHHRVKNNLQLISSIIFIKMRGINVSGFKDFLEDTRQKIRSIALIHERLLQTGSVNQVNALDYLGKLVLDLYMTNKRNDLDIVIDSEIYSENINLDIAIYCGLVINELVTNSIKHAFKDRNQGKIKVQLHHHENGHQLIVKDNGISIPNEVVIGKSETFGMQMLEIFVKQLSGKLEINRIGGTSFSIIF